MSGSSSPPDFLSAQPLMTPERLAALTSDFITPTVISAFKNIKAWAEDLSYEETAADHPDKGRRHPSPEAFMATAGVPWLSEGHLCALYVFGSGSGAALPVLEKLGWVRDVQEQTPTYDEIAFRFTVAGAEAFSDLMYPGQRLAIYRKNRALSKSPSIQSKRSRSRP